MLNLPALPPAAVDDLVRDFTAHLREVMDHASRARGREIAEHIAAAVQAPAARGARRQQKHAERQRDRLLKGLVGQLLRDLERATRLRVREAVNREWAARAAAAETERSAGAIATPKPRRRARLRPPPPPPDPEQLKRDAEVARLRALLRPADEEVPPPAPPTPAPIPVPAARATSPGDFLRSLEKEIQDAVPTLATLGPDRCGAQIAAWAGQVREFRERLSPELSALMRPAIRIFLEHLIELRTAMDATFVDALDPKWQPPSWPIYIEANRARAAGRRAELAPDQLVSHHRAMLKALVQPHRRHIADQAMAVIRAAGEVLPPSDSQLRSAIRRHSPAWAKGRPEKSGPAEAHAAGTAAGADAGEGAHEPLEAPPPAPPLPGALPLTTGVPEATPPAPSGDGEFDQPWTK